MIKISNIKTHHKYILFASIAMTFFLGGISLLSTKFNVLAATDAIINNKYNIESTDFITNKSINNTIDFIQKDLHSQQIQVLLDQKGYNKALEITQGKKAKDYFNRGVIFLTQAVNQNMSTQIDNLQEAKYLSEKSINNFEIAQKLQVDNLLDSAIQTNIFTAKQIYNFNVIKFCFAGSEELLNKLDLFTKDSELILNLLKAEQKYIKNNKTILNNISNTCENKLIKINKENQKDIYKFKKILTNYKTQYTKKYFDTLQDPILCSNNNLSETLGLLESTKKTIQKYKTEHIRSLKALQENDGKYLSELCKNIKNDSQLQNNISSELQDFFQNLQKELKPGNKETQQEYNKNKKGSHKNINQMESYINEQIQEKNIKRIQKVQKIKKQDYNPLKQLQSLFKEFYGNTTSYKDYEYKKQKYNNN